MPYKNWNKIFNKMYSQILFDGDKQVGIIKVAKAKHDPVICKCVSKCSSCACLPKNVTCS